MRVITRHELKHREKEQTNPIIKRDEKTLALTLKNTISTIALCTVCKTTFQPQIFEPAITRRHHQSPPSPQ